MWGARAHARNAGMAWFSWAVALTLGASDPGQLTKPHLQPPQHENPAADIAAAGQTFQGQARLAGVVADEEGKPVEGARIVLRPVKKEAGEAISTDVLGGEADFFESVSDKDGNWQHTGLAARAWLVTAFRQDLGVAECEAEALIPPSASFVELWLGGVGAEKVSSASDILERAHLLYRQGKPADAVPLLRSYLQQKPDALLVMLCIADCLKESGDLDGAIREYLDLLPRTQADGIVKWVAAKPLVGLGECLCEKGDRAGAVKHWKASVDISPTSDVIAANVAELLFADGKAAEATEYYTIALRIAPGRADRRYKLGLTYVNQGLFDKAVEAFKKVIEIDPSSDLAKTAGAAIDALAKR